MNYEKVISKCKDINNCEELLSVVIEEVRNKYFIDRYPDEVARACFECTRDIYLFFCYCSDNTENEYGFEGISLEKLGIPYRHFSGIVGFNTEKGPKWYLVDPTYGQFFENENFEKYMSDNYSDFSINLLNKGYVECNLQNMLMYINGFIRSKAFDIEVNDKEVYEKLEDLLISNNIVNKDIRKTQYRLIELLKLREELVGNNINFNEEKKK